MKRLILTLYTFYYLTNIGVSQINGGVKIGVDNYVRKDGQLSTVSVGGLADFETSYDLGYSLEVRFGFPQKVNGTYEAYRQVDNLLPKSISITGETKISFVHGFIGVRSYLRGGSFDDGGFYWRYGIGYSFVIADITFDFGSYSSDDYTVVDVVNDGEIKIGMQLGLHTFGGYEFVLGIGKFFGEIGIGLPIINKTTNIPIPYSLPLLILPSIGLRF
jgi:hypothetical protein